MAPGGGTLWVSVKPSLEGFGADLRRQIEQSVPPEIRVRIRPDDDPARQGTEYAGKFTDALKARLATALRNLPKAELDADATPAQRAIQQVRGELDALNGKRIGIDISAADARAELDRLTAKLDELARKSPDVRVRVDAAAARAELAAFAAEVDKLDGKNVKVNADTSGAQQGMSALLTAGLALGPALIPIGASAAAALLSIGPAALAGVGAIAAVGLAFQGIGSAVKAYDTAQSQSAANAGKNAGAQQSAAFAIANAQDSVTSAERGLAQARATAADGAVSAAEKVRNAQTAITTSEQNAAASVRSALDGQTSAEQGLSAAQRTQRQAQLDLVQARRDAAQQLRDLTFSTQDNALSQRGAQLGLEQAQANLAALGPGQAGTLAGRQAQLAVDQARQQIVELRAQGGDLAAQKQAADRAGIDGNTGVLAAQQRVTDAVQATGNAQRALQRANEAVTKAETDGARQVAAAEQALGDARRAQLAQRRSAQDSILSAEQSVTSAERGLEQARSSAAASTASASSATDAYAAAMKKLSPAGQDFVRFYESDLKPRLDDLGKTAQTGLLPGLESGVKAATPALDQLKGFIGNISGELGHLADEAGHALTSPFWHDFFDFMNTTAGPSIDKVAHAVGNFLTGAAGVMQALYQPVFVPIMDWIVKLSEKAANFGASAAGGTNSSFNSFLAYVKDNGPTVAKLLGDVVTIMDHWIQGMAGQGADTLDLAKLAMDAIAKLPPGVLAALTDAFVAWKLAQTAIGGVKSAVDGIKSGRDAYRDAREMWESIRGIRWSDVTSNLRTVYDRLGGIRTLGGLAGVLGVAAAIAGLELLSTKLDTLNAGWQQGPDGKPTTAAQKTTGQGFTNAAVTSLHSAAFGDQGTQIVDAVSKGDFASHETFDFKNSPVAHMFRDIGDQWNKDVANIPNSPAGKIWSTVSGWASKTATDVGKSGSEMWRDTTSWFSRTGSDIGRSASTAYRDVTGWFGRTGTDIGRSASDAWSSVTGWFSRTGSDIGRSSSNAWSTVTGWFSRAAGDVGKSSSDAAASASGWFGRMRDNVVGAAGDLWHGVTGWIGRLGGDLGHAWDGIVSYATRAWSGIRAAAAVPVNFLVQTVYGKGIVPAWDAVANLVGLGPLPAPGPPIAFAQGGRVPGDAPGAVPGRDSVHALVMPDEFVVPTAMVPALGGHARLEAMRRSIVGANGGGGGARGAGLPAFGLGGFIGDIWGDITDGASAIGGWIAHKAGAIGSFLTAAIRDPSSAVHGLFSGVGDELGRFARSGVGQDAIHFPGKVADVITTKVADAVKDLTSSFGGVSVNGGGAMQWLPTVLRVLSELGQSLLLAPGVLRRIQFESGGNPNAINLNDSNFLAGHPSQGLMQTIPSTFNAYAGPYRGLGITNPLANIYAGVNYADHRYGSVAAVDPLVRPMGYDNGGWVMPGLTVARNATGAPEAVLTQPQWAAVSSLAADVAHRGGDGAAMPRSFTVTGGQVEIVGDGILRIVNAQLAATGTAIATGRRP